MMISNNNNASILGPVTAGERITTVDVLRGCALLGILIINMDFFALPGAVFFNPPAAGGFEGIDKLVWILNSVVFKQKMMGIFAMLFGAGIILFTNRAEKLHKPVKGVYYRRMFWLLVFGLLHGYLLWHGDVLFTYALCGILLFPLRRLRAGWLIGVAVLMLVFGALIQIGSGSYYATLKHEAAAAETARAAGEELTPLQKRWVAEWQGMTHIFNASPDEVAEQIEAYRGGYLDIVRFRAPETLMMQTQALVYLVIWRAAGMMLLGMALMKLGIFSGERSVRFYCWLALIGYGIGLPLCAYGAFSLIEHNFDFIYRFQLGNSFNYFGGVFVALAHVGVIVLVYKSQIWSWLTRRLAAVGRMAFSNYLLHSLVFTTVFYGYGFGLFGKVSRLGLELMVPVMWTLQLVFSIIWLDHFRFGPAEWLWRSLTYGRRQSMKR